MKKIVWNDRLHCRVLQALEEWSYRFPRAKRVRVPLEIDEDWLTELRRPIHKVAVLTLDGHLVRFSRRIRDCARPLTEYLVPKEFSSYLWADTGP